MRVFSAFIIGACWYSSSGVADTGLDGVERARLHRGWHLLETGSPEQAASVFEGIVSSDLVRPKAMIGLARAYEALGRNDAAEAAWRRLPTDPVAMEGLAMLLLESRPEESLALARRLQALRLEEAQPHLLESRAALAGGLLEDAVGAATRYAGWPDQLELTGEDAEYYLRLAAALRKADRPMEALVWVQRTLEESQERAWVELAREELLKIREQKAQGLAEAAGGMDAEVYGRAGDLKRSQGDLAGAEEAFRTAAALEPENPTWPASLGKLLADHYSGRRREAAIEYEAALALREKVVEEPLDVIEADPEPVAVASKADSSTPLWPLGLGALMALLRWVSWRGRAQGKGVGIRELVDEVPDESGEILTVLYSLQHDVIKHNTSILPALAEALESGERDLALDVASRVLGRDGGRGVLERWKQGMDRIESLGGRHGIKVSLRLADPVLAPMCRAMEDLGKEARQLHRLGAVSPERVREISTIINEVGAPALSQLIAELGACLLSRGMVERIFEAVRSEPSGAAGQGARLEFVGALEPVRIRIVPRDIDIVLSNLFRNALGAIGEEPGRGRVGIRVECRVDSVTGLEEVVIQVLDSAPMLLGEEAILRQPAHRGLGMVREILARHGGVLRIEQVPGWEKAMAIHLAGVGA